MAALLIATSFTLSLLWTFLLGARSGKVILENCQGAFCLRVVEGIHDRGLFSAEQRYEIWITRAGSPDYGYVLHHSFGWNDWDTNRTIRACRVEWSPQGVSLREPTGQSVFVPSTLYERGR